MKWSWPQYVMLFWYLFSAVVSVVRPIKDDNYTSGQAVIYIFTAWSLLIGLTLVLSAGGFW